MPITSIVVHCMEKVRSLRAEQGSVQELRGALTQTEVGCSHMAKKEFSATETQNIIKYRNDQFYQFR